MLLALTATPTGDATYTDLAANSVQPQTVAGLAQYAAAGSASGVTDPTGGHPATVSPAAGSDSVSTFLETVGNDARAAGEAYSAIRDAVSGNPTGAPVEPATLNAPPPSASAGMSKTEWLVAAGVIVALAFLVTRK